MLKIRRPVTFRLFLLLFFLTVFVYQMGRLDYDAFSLKENLLEEHVLAPTVQKITTRIALICCGNRARDTLVSIKSALIFSQDAALEMFVIADKTCLPKLSQGIKDMKRGWNSSFAYKIIPHYYPNGTETWKVPKHWMCSTNRLFLPTILPETDAVLYLDTDVMIVSSMSEIWEYFEKDLREKPYVVASLANHVPPPANYWYHYRDIPHFGNGGINSGVLFMNLTRMREFEFEKLAIEAYHQYEGKLEGGPDQDIFNIVFGTHKENGTIMECNYNLNPENCASGGHKCKFSDSDTKDGQVCFCNSTVSDGVKIVHGFYGHFHWGKLHFMQNLHREFSKIALGFTDVLDVIRNLKEDFTTLPYQPFCFLLTAEAMYKNAEEYLRRLSVSGNI